MIESKEKVREMIDDLFHGKTTVDSFNDIIAGDMVRIKEIVEFVDLVAFHGLYSKACNGTMEYYLGVIKDALKELSKLTYKNWSDEPKHENGGTR